MGWLIVVLMLFSGCAAVRSDDATRQGYGYSVGTPGYENCRRDLFNRRREQVAALRSVQINYRQ
jgi:uncharacterized protein YceK